MYLLYVDESGTPYQSDKGQYYGLSTVIINDEDWKIIDNAIEDLKKRHSIREIHTREIYLLTRAYSHLTDANARSILGDVFSLIASINVKLISVIIDKRRFFSLFQYDDPEYIAWKFIFERMDICIDRLGSSKKYYENGIVIMDAKDNNRDNNIRNYLKTFRTSGTEYATLAYIWG
jgi:hypothetical protein